KLPDPRLRDRPRQTKVRPMRKLRFFPLAVIPFISLAVVAACSSTSGTTAPGTDAGQAQDGSPPVDASHPIDANMPPPVDAGHDSAVAIDSSMPTDSGGGDTAMPTD